MSRPTSASKLTTGAFERCQEVAHGEVIKASKASNLQDANALLQKPLVTLAGLRGLPPSLIHRCQVTMRGQEALQRVPMPLRREWSAKTLDAWTAQALQTHESHAVCADSGPNLPRGMRIKAMDVDITKHRGAHPTEEAFALLEKWVSAMRAVQQRLFVIWISAGRELGHVEHCSARLWLLCMGLTQTCRQIRLRLRCADSFPKVMMANGDSLKNLFQHWNWRRRLIPALLFMPEFQRIKRSIPDQLPPLHAPDEACRTALFRGRTKVPVLEVCA